MDGVTLTFTYNADGIRTSKTVGGSEHIYHLNGSQIITETWTQGQSAMIYLYDAEGSPIGMKYRDGNMAVGEFEEYWFEKNLQGDIVAVYDAAGTKLISYTYDAWGNFTTTYHNNCTASHHANLNPFRYRGYYYDSETGLYYLQSRYYDPVTARFINSDKYASTGQGILGNNMFAYCHNNPLKYRDATGESVVLIGFVVAVVIAGGANALSTAINGGSLEECAVSFLIGAASGAVGFGISALFGFANPYGNIAARAVSSAMCDFTTTWYLNGEITSDDVGFIFSDVLMDTCISVVVYDYNTIKKFVPQVAINSLADGVVDVFETRAFLEIQAQKEDNRGGGFVGRTETVMLPY